MQKIYIYLIQEHNVNDAQGHWRTLEAGGSIELLQERWQRDWYDNRGTPMARKKYVNSPRIQSLRIVAIPMYVNDLASAAAAFFKGETQ